MATDSTPLRAARYPSHREDAESLGATLSEVLSALSDLLRARPRPPEVVALGEPTHGEPAFSEVRNEVLAALVDRGFRSIAVESDTAAALDVDRYVKGGDQDLDHAMAVGFSHGLHELRANRELVAWLRSHNDTRPPASRVSFYGFDLPLEMTHASSPRRHLQRLQGYLTEHLPQQTVPHSSGTIDRLVGDDATWDSPAALMDATQSVGGSADATMLRVVADDLLTVLHAHAPDLVASTSLDAWYHAEVVGRTALGLLRYHAEAARPAPPEQRTSRLLGIRDALMAQNLLAVLARERRRGPTLVFAQNRHLQHHPSTWRLADMDLRWNSAGAIVATLLGDGYTFVAGSLGTSVALALPAPSPDTYEGVLEQMTGGSDGLFDSVRLRTALQGRPEGLHPRSDTSPEQGYFPLDTATLQQCDAVLHLSRPAGPGGVDSDPVSVDALSTRILALPSVSQLEATEQGGAPESNWGNRFFYVEGDDMRPFATIVLRNMPGFDEESELDRPGLFRLNVDLGRQAFEREFGYPPGRLADHRAGIDFTRLDQLTPHPVYGGQGWAAVLNPGRHRLDDLDRLLQHAHQKALVRAQRRQERLHRDGRPDTPEN